MFTKNLLTDILKFTELRGAAIALHDIDPERLETAGIGWVNTWWGVLVPRAAEAFGIFMVSQFMVSIPDELIEAARLDGAGEFEIFRKIVLPNSWPVIAVLTIFTFMWR